MDNLSIDGITAVLTSAVENGYSFSVNVHLPDDSLHTAVALAEQCLGGNSHRQVRVMTQASGVVVISAERGKGQIDIYTQLSKPSLEPVGLDDSYATADGSEVYYSDSHHSWVRRWEVDGEPFSESISAASAQRLVSEGPA